MSAAHEKEAECQLCLSVSRRATHGRGTCELSRQRRNAVVCMDTKPAAPLIARAPLLSVSL